MRRRLFIWEAAGFISVLVLGALLGCLYRWSGGNRLTAAFSAVNDSTWEHMKVLFFPVFFFSVVQVCAMGGSYPNFLAVRAASVLAGLAGIPVLYYTCAGVTGQAAPWIHGAAFVLADLGIFCLDARLLLRGKLPRLWQQVLGLLVLWALAFCFVWYSFRPGGLPGGLGG